MQLALEMPAVLARPQFYRHDNDDDNGSKWKCQENVRQLIKKLAAAIKFHRAGISRATRKQRD